VITVYTEYMYLLFDIGKSKMRLALSPDGRHIDHPTIFPTPATVDEAINLFQAHMLHHGKYHPPLKAAAGGFGGSLSHDRTMIIKAPNRPGWDNQPLKEKLQHALQAPVYLENDAAIVGLGEAITGPGLGKKIVAYITVSTGVGGARIVNGKIDPAYYNYEPGHQIISVGEQKDGKPVFGYLEDFISGEALKKAFGKEPEHINDAQTWDDVAFFLSIGLNNVIVHWSPEIIVLGGGVMKHIDIDLVKKYLTPILRMYPKLPEIHKAKLDDVGGLYGALEFLKQNHS
jgi:predicted NBD/HSP70 family sugar kinase